MSSSRAAPPNAPGRRQRIVGPSAPAMCSGGRDVGDYLDERREALEKWDAYVLRLLTSTANVVPFPAGRAAGARA